MIAQVRVITDKRQAPDRWVVRLPQFRTVLYATTEEGLDERVADFLRVRLSMFDDLADIVTYLDANCVEHDIKRPQSDASEGSRSSVQHQVLIGAA